MHDLEQLIAAWRKTAIAAGDVSVETLDELESHLRETVDPLLRSGKSEPEAFQCALAQLGATPTIASEFRKLDPSLWLPAKVMIGFTFALALVLAVWLFNRPDARPTRWLLAGHVFAVTLGYTTTLLIGGLGICFVAQRAVSEFPTSRLRSLVRFSFVFGCIALCMTAVGVILGMAWTKAEWGRYWAWDLPETGGFCVLAWQACFLIAHRFAGGNARAILALSLLGNIIVTLAWFGPRLLGGLHAYGKPKFSAMLLVAIVSHLLFFLIGFAPAGWLRPRKT